MRGNTDTDPHLSGIARLMEDGAIYSVGIWRLRMEYKAAGTLNVNAQLGMEVSSRLPSQLLRGGEGNGPYYPIRLIVSKLTSSTSPTQITEPNRLTR